MIGAPEGGNTLTCSPVSKAVGTTFHVTILSYTERSSFRSVEGRGGRRVEDCTDFCEEQYLSTVK